MVRARKLLKQSQEPLQALKEKKEKKEATKKAAVEAQQRAIRRVAETKARDAAEKGRQDSCHAMSHSRAEQFDKIPDSLF